MELKEFLNELKSEPDPREAQWLRLGIGHQYVEPNRAPPSTLGVKHEPWLSGFNRGNRVLVDGDKSLVQEKPPATAADIGEHGDGAETALLLLRDFFSRRSVAVLMSIFQDVDVDNSGRIDVDEFGTALRTLNMHLSPEDVRGLFDHFDADRSGSCEISEILATIKAEPTPEEMRWQRVGIGKQTMTPTRDVHVKGVQASTGMSGFGRRDHLGPSAAKGAARQAGQPAAAAAAAAPSVGADIVQSVQTFLSQRPQGATMTVFRDQDKDRSGKIELSEFSNALKQLGMNDLSDADIAAAFAQFDPDGSGVLELSELLVELRREPATGFLRRGSGVAGRGVHLGAAAFNAAGAFNTRADCRTKQGPGVSPFSATGFAAEKALASGFASGVAIKGDADPRGDKAMGERLADIMIMLRDFFSKRPSSAILGAFRAQDFDRSGKFEIVEFTKSLKVFGFQLTDAEYGLVFNWFDHDGSGQCGKVELKEFLNELRAEPASSWSRVGIGRARAYPPALTKPPAQSELRYESNSFTRECTVRGDSYKVPEPAPTGAGVGEHKAVENALATLRHFFEQRPFSILLGCFRQQDLDGSGQLELPAFSRALTSLGIDLSEADIAGVFAALDSDGSGVMELKEFLNELKREPDPREAQWLRLGVGHQYVEPNRVPPATQGVLAEPWLSGFNRASRGLVGNGRGAQHDDEEMPEKLAASRAAAALLTTIPTNVSASAETALLLLRDFFSRRSTAALMTLFQEVDVDNSGQIDGGEFCMALRQLNMQLSEEDMLALFGYFDKDGGGVCEVSEIIATIKAEPTAEEARWTQLGIGKHTLYPTRDVYVKGVQPSTGQSGFAKSINHDFLKNLPTNRARAPQPPQQPQQPQPQQQLPPGSLSAQTDARPPMTSWPPVFARAPPVARAEFR